MPNKENPKICRITSLRGFNGIIVGRDLGNVLKEGHVYSVREVMDEIIIKDLGEHAYAEWMEKDGVPVATVSDCLMSGVTKMTKVEYELQLKGKELDSGSSD